MSPKEVVKKWIEFFNKADIEGLISLYSKDCINDQVVFDQPIQGHDEMRRLFEVDFERAEMVCVEEKIFEIDDYAILQWSDPKGFKGCGFFQVKDGKIIHQRGYFDQLSFFKKNNLSVPPSYL